MPILCHKLTRKSAVKSRVDVFAPQKLEVQKLARTPIFEPHPVPKNLIRSAKSSIIKIDNYNDKILFIYCRGLVIFFNK